MPTNLKVLIVEDSEADAALLRRQLERAGYQLRAERVDSGDALAAALDAGPWDLVLCDYNLPGFSGAEALRHIRDRGRDMPFIFVSGTMGEDVAVEALKSGAQDYVMKGNLGRLVPAVQRVLREVETLRQQQAAERAMRESEHKYRRLFETMGEAALLVHADTERILDANDQIGKLLGRTRADILGTSVRALFPPARAAEWAQRLLGHQTGTAPIHFEADLIAHGGRLVPVAVSAVSLRLYDRRMVLGLFRDMRERKQSEAALRALAARLQQVREEERTGIARELHDQLGQTLTGLQLDLSWMDRKLAGLPADDTVASLREKIGEMARSIETAVETVRRISSELRPAALDDLGLVAAIEWQAQEFQSRTGIRCRLTAPSESPALPPTHSTALFRILQEALTNVARHAHATAVEIRLSEREGLLQLEIADNGRGISQAEATATTSLGLLGMRERAAAVGGELRVEGGPGQGTRVVVRVPGG